jgi:hypothetical protein
VENGLTDFFRVESNRRTMDAGDLYRELQAIMSIIIGFLFSLCFILVFVGLAWYVSFSPQTYQFRFVTWRWTLSKLPFFREMTIAAQAGKRQVG